jgi:predicted RecA/RadA family phage recombinase
MANYPNMAGFQAAYVNAEGVIPYTPTAFTQAGSVIVVGAHIGITKLDIPANMLGEVHTKGIYAMPKGTSGGSGAALAWGTEVYWDATDGIVTAAANNGATPPVPYIYIGWISQQTAPADADTNVLVKLRQ